MKLNIIKRNRVREQKIKNLENQNKDKNKNQTPQQDPATVLNYTNLKNMYSQSEDVKYKDIIINDKPNMIAHLMFIDGMANLEYITLGIIKPFLEEPKIRNAENIADVVKYIRDGSIYFPEQSETQDISRVAPSMSNGSCILIFDNENFCFIFETITYDKRSMMEPTLENVNKGPKDSFIENYRSNTATLRKKIKTPDLIIESITLGQRTETAVGIVYIKSIANDQIVEQVKNKLKAVNVDNVLTTSIIEDALSEDMMCSLPQVVTTERPDKFSSDIIEGRVGVLVDGIPFGFIVPATFNQLMQSPEDYSRKTVVASFIRIIRFTSLFFAIFLPGLYIAITTFHLEMIPTDFLLFIAKSREGVAFPTDLETILLLLAFEILFEAGLRIPKSIGQTVSIVGTLVVGQAAVQAKLVSPGVVVMVAMTVIASFTVPNQDLNNSVRLWRLASTVCGMVLGLLGIVIAMILLTFEFCKLTSYGVPYMAPFVGSNNQDALYDTILRMPAVYNKRRPACIKPKDIKRVGD